MKLRRRICQAPSCKNEYEPKKFWQKYCSIDCKMKAYWTKKLKIVCMLFLFLSLSQTCLAYTNEQIVSAIYKAEGGSNAEYLYGIRSVTYESPSEARQICFNTVRNQRRRHKAHICNLSYLECLAQRYCPVGAKNDRKNLNQYWLKNVKYFLRNK